ncbi:arylesterase [Shimia abyssi]|uniref:Acyl-CoA thioesterase-1 n=1 Tax=Shimia abyssi TaxID=1662395 RepID=A0A2P8FEI7_9RHOB|nr:acyl-CoA thioesterase-1 [Shimia abyssi]
MKVFAELYGCVRTGGKALGLGLFLCGTAIAEPVVVAALGDSLTHGYGLALEDGFVPQLQGWLNAQGAEVRLINAGVSGDTTQGGLARVDWTLTPDVEALIVALGGNDVLRAFDPALSRSNLAGIIEAAQAKGVEVMLVGMTAPLNYGAEYKAAFDGMYPDLANEYETLLAPDFFAGLRDVAPDDLPGVMQGDGLHPNSDGVTRIVDALGPHVLRLIAAVE